jgi:hypothetical protein
MARAVSPTRAANHGDYELSGRSGKEASKHMRTTVKKEVRKRVWALAIFLAVLGISSAHAQEQGNTDVELAKKLANPIASLVSVPFQFNYDSGYGPANGNKPSSTSSRLSRLS